MANSNWTKEERERAIEQLRDNTLVTDLRLGPMIYLAIAIDLQCSLNRLQDEVREARELLQQAIGTDEDLLYIVECNTQDPDMHEKECPAGYELKCGRCDYKHSVSAWLSRNK